MPTYFEIVVETLDRSYAEIDASNKDDLISTRLTELTKKYSNLLATGGPSYTDDITRFAYVFRYSTAHADYLHQVVSYSPELRKALAGDIVTVTCIGGGPGSDVLGFLKYFLASKTQQKIIFFILDREPAWGETWADLDATVSRELTTSRTYLPVDVTVPSTYGYLTKPFRADIFTMLYFLSEIYKFKSAVDPFFAACFSKMRKGTILVVIDFHNSKLETWIDSCAKQHGLETATAADDFKVTMTSGEEKSVIKKYMEKFGNPKLRAQIFLRVFRKT